MENYVKLYPQTMFYLSFTLKLRGDGEFHCVKKGYVELQTQLSRRRMQDAQRFCV